jgi:hypothetical protein
VTGRCRRAAAAVAACFAPIWSPLLGQATGTAGVSASIIEYDGFLTTGAGVFSSALQFEAPNLSLGVQGAWTVFESGNQILQGTAAAGWLAPPRGAWRLELAGASGASKYATEPGAAYVLARARLHVAGARTGAWIGGTSGGSFGESARLPLELSVAAWRVKGRMALVGTVTQTWLGGDRHLDLQGAARWTGDRVELEARAGARPWVRSQGAVGEARTGGYGEVTAVVSVGRRIALELSGGSYPSDPVRQVLGATYFTAGVRWRIFGRQASEVPLLSGLRARAVPAESADISRARLQITQLGSPLTLRMHVTGARSVELMGDFTDWMPVALVQIGPTLWEIRLPVASGVHRVNVRVDGSRWLVPAGTRLERTEFGDAVGIIVVP